MAQSEGAAFADSYLSGAIQDGLKLTPHTTIAHDRIAKSPWARKVLEERGMVLIRPLPFGHPDRPDSFASAA